MIFYCNIRKQSPILKDLQSLFQTKGFMHVYRLRITFSKCFFKNAFLRMLGQIFSKTNRMFTFYLFLNLTVFSFSFQESIKYQLTDHSKRKSLKTTPPNSCHTSPFFLQTLPPYAIH